MVRAFACWWWLGGHEGAAIRPDGTDVHGLLVEQVLRIVVDLTVSLPALARVILAHGLAVALDAAEAADDRNGEVVTDVDQEDVAILHLDLERPGVVGPAHESSFRK